MLAIFLFSSLRFQKSTELQRVKCAKKEKGRERVRQGGREGGRERQAATRNTKQNYRLRAQHHHKSQVYGYVGRIRA